MKINKLPKLILITLFIISHAKTFAQMGVNATGTPPANNAMLDVSSTTKGLLIPRMTTAQRNALAHSQGLTVFDITTNGYWYSDGAVWVNLATISSASPWLTSGNNIYKSNIGNVGIGTSTPQAFFTVATNKTVLFGSDTSGSGNKLIWYGKKAAFRAGQATIDEFDYGKVGSFSTAFGYGNIASGDNASAFGVFSTATGYTSFAAGNGAKATGDNATALGSVTMASGNASLATGIYTVASGDYSTAMGRSASTNLHLNSFCIAGTSSAAANTANTADNQMMMRFDNYTFFVAGTNNYAYIIPSSNGWAYTSDKNRKENFEELNGETVLKKIAKIPFYSWNFKDKEVKQYRHYGIIAQDFHDNFGKDNLGVIGNDTTVSALDLLGVAYSGIKALEKRTEVLQNLNKILLTELAELKAIIQPKRKKYALKKIQVAKKEDLFTLK